MTRQQILEKAIRKAIKGGYSPGWKDRYDLEGGTLMVGSHYDDEIPIFEVIFNHNFAKALWGEEENKYFYKDIVFLVPAWQWHIWQMVWADDPIAYLGANI